MEDEKDIVTVSDDVLAVCAINATLKTEGVAEMAGGIKNTLSKRGQSNTKQWPDFH